MSATDNPTILNDLTESLRARVQEIDADLQQYDELVQERDRLLAAIRELDPPRRGGRPKKNP